MQVICGVTTCVYVYCDKANLSIAVAWLSRHTSVILQVLDQSREQVSIETEENEHTHKTNKNKHCLKQITPLAWSNNSVAR